MIQFAKDYLLDRINACWVGKNIGGTLGTPYEGTKEILDVKGFVSKPGEPFPNDDLDLQLVWLRAVNDLGPDAINSKVLGEYWISYITPNWAEYGVSKSNMRDGILAPMSGEINNPYWRDSNGAWIRTEIWACLYPAMPEKAIRLAFEDASVDHGYGEGTFAAMFVAALESAAFAVHDVGQLLDIGLSKIPEDCRGARSIRIVRDSYEKGLDWKECRELLVKDSEDLGWFQAPANVAFVALGLLYGGGDFKRSMLITIDCGDDTDCTGATIGSIFGIMNGMSGIPADWMEYIGDGIKSICLVNGHGRYPVSNAELTKCVFNLLPASLRRDHRQFLTRLCMAPEDMDYVCIGDTNDFSGLDIASMKGRDFADRIGARSRYSYQYEGVYADALIEFDGYPRIGPSASLSGRISLIPKKFFPEQKHYRLTFYCPEGWQVASDRDLYTPDPMWPKDVEWGQSSTRFTITSGECVEAVNRIILQIVCPGRPTPILVPIQVLG